MGFISDLVSSAASVAGAAAPLVGGAIGGPAGAIAGNLVGGALGGTPANILAGGQAASSLFTAKEIEDAARLKATGIREGTGIAAGGALEGSQIAAGALDTAQGQFQPFTVGGTEAADLEAALSGALGPEAQQAALDAQVESPFSQFIRRSGERSINQGAAVTGGLGGGERLKALTQFGQDIGTSTIQNQLENLRSVRRQGTQASSNIADLISRAGGVRGSGVASEASIRGGGVASAAGAEAQGQLGAAEQFQAGTEGLTNIFALKDQLNRGAR
jgi:hypothetical protein